MVLDVYVTYVIQVFYCIEILSILNYIFHATDGVFEKRFNHFIDFFTGTKTNTSNNQQETTPVATFFSQVKPKSPKLYQYYKNIYKLRLKMIGIPITIEEAKQRLQITSNPDELTLFNFVAQQSNEIYYIYDHTKNLTNENIAEYIVFLHNNRDYVAYYQIIPFSLNNAKGFTSVPQDKFWNSCDFNNLLFENYRRYKSILKIQRYIYNNWLGKPVCRDGKLGILCKIGWDNIQELQKIK